MIEPVRAVVPPRVVIGGSGVQLRLVDEVRERLDEGGVGLIQLAGPPGCGKSTALAHLACECGDDSRLLIEDHASSSMVTALDFAARFKLGVFAAAECAYVPKGTESWRIAAWTQDSWIEYLLAAHHDQCAPVMQRVLADVDRSGMGDRPELWRLVLDALVADNALLDTRSALRSVIANHLQTANERRDARSHCFALWQRPEVSPKLQKTTSWKVGADALRLLRHSLPQQLLAAEYLADAIDGKQARKLLAERLPITLIAETARLIADNEPALMHLEQIVNSRRPQGQPMAVSLLHAARSGWAPRGGGELNIAGAYLDRAQWAGFQCQQLSAHKAELKECNLREAQCYRLDAYDADLTGATLQRATIRRLFAVSAQLVDADLSEIRASTARFCAANLQRANLEAALLRRSDFRTADLRDANFRRADLRGADLISAQLAGADFSGADLSYADLSGVRLCEAEFLGANLEGAMLCNCNLEGMTLPGARLQHADLGGAYLTGSRMPNANLRDARLKCAGLAEIDWEQADLRGADLRGCTFHLGSSRSGLVGSPLACEGSRTGFYTDELNEQDFKAPEEIRKANLRGSDLRGAKFLNVDFYLVDVRDCLYTPEQEAHLRRTGAILETRV